MDAKLHFDLNNNQPPHQVDAAALKRSITTFTAAPVLTPPAATDQRPARK